MLQSLNLIHVALLSSLTIDFGKGLNILIGETGAGKSIIFDSLNFVLGSKPDKTLIRSGENEMKVEALFSNINNQAKELLNNLGFEDEEILLSRILTLEGKSTIRINGCISTLSILKQVGAILLDSYSQHESIELLNSKNHINLLDKYAGENILELKEEVKNLYLKNLEISKKIDSLGGDKFLRDNEISLLEYQINEIENANIVEGEEEDLKERMNLMNNSERIVNAINNCEQLLSEQNDSCITSLQYCQNYLSTLNFEKINSCRERIESVKYEIEDIYETLLDVKNDVDFDEKEFQQIDLRLDLIKSIYKKYGGTYENVINFLKKSKERLNGLVDGEYLLEKYQNQQLIIVNDLNEKALKLSQLRIKVAQTIEEKVLNQLKDLGMKSSQFKINFEKTEISSNGFDKIEFVFSANLGQEIKSLSKTASGGELSRFMLAFKNIFSENGSVSTLIFDEVDAGIGGEVGVVVGEKLSNIKNNIQVICITHLPQVACFGDDFYYVSKTENEGKTLTSVKHLQEDEIVYNLAKMIGGDVSDIAISHAKEMRNKYYKN